MDPSDVAIQPFQSEPCAGDEEQHEQQADHFGSFSNLIAHSIAQAIGIGAASHVPCEDGRFANEVGGSDAQDDEGDNNATNPIASGSAQLRTSRRHRPGRGRDRRTTLGLARRWGRQPIVERRSGLSQGAQQHLAGGARILLRGMVPEPDAEIGCQIGESVGAPTWPRLAGNGAGIQPTASDVRQTIFSDGLPESDLIEFGMRDDDLTGEETLDITM